MRKGRIENWQEMNFFGGTRLFGNIYECSAFSEGEEMMTSEVVKYHTVMGQMIAETRSGSMYHLGKAAEKNRTMQEIISSVIHQEFGNPRLN